MSSNFGCSAIPCPLWFFSATLVSLYDQTFSFRVKIQWRRTYDLKVSEKFSILLEHLILRTSTYIDLGYLNLSHRKDIRIVQIESTIRNTIIFNINILVSSFFFFFFSFLSYVFSFRRNVAVSVSSFNFRLYTLDILVYVCVVAHVCRYRIPSYESRVFDPRKLQSKYAFISGFQFIKLKNQTSPRKKHTRAKEDKIRLTNQ